MVIVELMGGMGNQLFQYAMARAIAQKNKVDVKIDLSFFKDYEWHVYSLSPFNITATIATDDECAHIKNKYQSFYYKIRRKLFHTEEVIVREENMLYNQRYENIQSPVYLSGYWQCEKYFQDFEKIIRKELQINIPPSDHNKKMLDQILNTNAISLHIRRGNYVSVPEFNRVIGVCSMEYYHKAMEYMQAIIATPVFYVFSDDIAWAKENLGSKYSFVFVDINNASKDYEDLRLMNHCKHHIIANSTFSWWGAWLNNATTKTVIAPERWFADEKKNKEAINIVPENWIRF